MKILFLSLNQSYFNNMDTNYLNSFAELADVTFYGPGFIGDDILENGLLDYYKQNGPFDAVICTYTLMQKSIVISPIRDIFFFHRDFMSYYDISKAIRYVPSILEDFERINDSVKMVFYNGDMATMSRNVCDYCSKLLENDTYIISPGREFVAELKEKAFFAGVESNTIYKGFINKYCEKVVSFTPCAVTSSEYDFTPLEKREYDFVFPGVITNEYPNRLKIRAILQGENYKVFDEYSDRAKGHKTESKYPSVYSVPNRKSQDIAYWREEFNVSLKKSKCAYTDGSSVKCIVRKYFEIPARGTVLLCDEVPGLKEMGFKDGINMILVNEDNIKEKVKELFEDIDLMQRIAKEGFELVAKNHTARHRVVNTLDAIAKIKEGIFRGSAWENGEFVLF